MLVESNFTQEEMMVSHEAATHEIEVFIQSWSGEEQPMREMFSRFFRELSALDGVQFDFMARPGVSYSMRPKHVLQVDRKLFSIVDVIDDDPLQRWLSVCFFSDMITDPEQRGEVIPGGLDGADGYCFDLLENDADLAQYLLARLREAWAAAKELG